MTARAIMKMRTMVKKNKGAKKLIDKGLATGLLLPVLLSQ